MCCGFLLSRTWKSEACRPWTGCPFSSVTVISTSTTRVSACSVYPEDGGGVCCAESNIVERNRAENPKPEAPKVLNRQRDMADSRAEKKQYWTSSSSGKAQSKPV